MNDQDLASPSELAADEMRKVVTTRCLNCGWVGSYLDDARRHARQTSCTDFRTVTEVVSASGRLVGEMVEVHQL